MLQDDVSGAGSPVEWRIQTNATIEIDQAKTTATLELGGKKLSAVILNAPSGVEFSKEDPVKPSGAPESPATATWNGESYDGNPPHPGVSVLAITVPNGGDFSLQVLFNPDYGSDVKLVTPERVAVTEWSTTSHKN